MGPTTFRTKTEDPWTWGGSNPRLLAFQQPIYERSPSIRTVLLRVLRLIRYYVRSLDDRVLLDPGSAAVQAATRLWVASHASASSAIDVESSVTLVPAFQLA